jgi:hypothetical protein
MASLLYKDYLIVATADFDSATAQWVSFVTVSWKNDGRQELHTLNRLPNPFPSRWDAVAFGVEKGKAWVDYHGHPR